MLFTTTIFAAALAGAAFAEDHKVVVSDKTGSLAFNPSNLTAAEGDTVTFHFWPKNHSVAQAAFDSPCQPLANGFWSGFVPTTSTEALANTTFTYEVKNASAPVWFYCTQGKHCQNGMVGVINPP
jgi:plastocyanin